jgi:hypothetical protein
MAQQLFCSGLQGLRVGNARNRSVLVQVAVSQVGLDYVNRARENAKWRRGARFKGAYRGAGSWGWTFRPVILPLTA